MGNQQSPPRGPFQWIEFCWLCAVDPRFRATRNKRKAYFEHRMVKGFGIWFIC
jgi:hypothetical protein